MYTHLLIACLISLVGVNSIPVPNNELDIVQVPLSNGKELDVLTMGDSQALSERNKRTIGLLRELFPDITKQIDEQANKIISQVIRVLGPTVLRTAIQGNGGAGGSSASSAREDFDADFDDDDDDNNKTDDDSSSSSSSDTSTRVKIELPTFSPDSSENETDSDTTTKSSASNEAADDSEAADSKK